MRLLSLVAVTALTASVAHAETVSCAFTEPFLTVIYDPAQKTVSVHEAIENNTEVYNVQSVISGADGSTEVTYTNKSGTVRSLKYVIDAQGGSDGMSNFIFPMTGTLGTKGSAHTLVGGCETPSNPSIDPEDSPLPGCYEVLQGQYEDGASYYKAIGEKIVNPLLAKPANKVLGDFLSSALVVRGYLNLDFQLCRTIDDSVKK